MDNKPRLIMAPITDADRAARIIRCEVRIPVTEITFTLTVRDYESDRDPGDEQPCA